MIAMLLERKTFCSASENISFNGKTLVTFVFLFLFLFTFVSNDWRFALDWLCAVCVCACPVCSMLLLALLMNERYATCAVGAGNGCGFALYARSVDFNRHRRCSR